MHIRKIIDIPDPSMKFEELSDYCLNNTQELNEKIYYRIIEMLPLAKGHEKGTLALLTIIPLFLFYGLVYASLLFLIPIIFIILLL